MSLTVIMEENGFSHEETEKFSIYHKLLAEWNEKINLTAITEENEVAVKHFIDCVKGVGTLKGDISVIDVGTGAGFPGLPVKICNPAINLTLVDSLNKRINFLNEVVSHLGLEGVETVHSRAEELGINPKYREKYDMCVSRAVANLTTLCELCLPFVKVGGSFVSLKGPKSQEEVDEAKKAIQILGGRLKTITPYELPGGEFSHNTVVIEKISHTPTKYPRKAPKPSKEPLV